MAVGDASSGKETMEWCKRQKRASVHQANRDRTARQGEQGERSRNKSTSSSPWQSWDYRASSTCPARARSIALKAYIAQAQPIAASNELSTLLHEVNTVPHTSKHRLCPHPSCRVCLSSCCLTFSPFVSASLGRPSMSSLRSTVLTARTLWLTISTLDTRA